MLSFEYTVASNRGKHLKLLFESRVKFQSLHALPVDRSHYSTVEYFWERYRPSSNHERCQLGIRGRVLLHDPFGTLWETKVYGFRGEVWLRGNFLTLKNIKKRKSTNCIITRLSSGETLSGSKILEPGYLPSENHRIRRGPADLNWRLWQVAIVL